MDKLSESIMSISNKDSSIYDELTELHESNMSKDLEILRLTQTISVLQTDIVEAFNKSKLEVMVLQNKLDKRVLQ